MNSTTPEQRALFDNFADDYDAALSQGISVSGEDKDFFARGRVEWLARCLHRLGERPRSALDFGCGTGSSVPCLLQLLGLSSVVGVDISPKAIDVARHTNKFNQATFLLLDAYRPDGQMDLAFCNGVFHHIPPAQRLEAVHYVYRSLRPGGYFVFWENNPWNPGTHYVMSRIPFDRDAIMLTPPQARGLLRKAGFEVLDTSFRFIFPRALRHLRVIEPMLSRLPLGAQYQVLARKLPTAAC